MDWISVKDGYPQDNQSVLIKIWDDKNNCVCEVPAIFTDREDYRSWEIDNQYFENRSLIAKPTHWKPNPPKDEE